MIKQKTELVRGLTLTTSIMIVAGSMIGSGIFRKPATMAGQLMSPELLLFVWLAAGIITFIGALCNAEVSGIIDATGGQYVYFQKMYGNFLSYLYGWSVFAVIQTGSQAAIAYVFGEYLGYFIKYPELPKTLQDFSFYIPVIGNIFPFAEFGPKAAAIISILFLTGINYIGVIFGGVVQSVITFIKIASIIFLSFSFFFFLSFLIFVPFFISCSPFSFVSFSVSSSCYCPTLVFFTLIHFTSLVYLLFQQPLLALLLPVLS